MAMRLALVPAVVFAALGCAGKKEPAHDSDPRASPTIPADVPRAKEDEPVRLSALLEALPKQTGQTTWPYVDVRREIPRPQPRVFLFEHPPARDIVLYGERAVPLLAAKLSDYTWTAAYHLYPSNIWGYYSVSDIACFILVRIGGDEARALVRAEVERRRGSRGYHPGAIWALRFQGVDAE